MSATRSKSDVLTIGFAESSEPFALSFTFPDHSKILVGKNKNLSKLQEGCKEMPNRFASVRKELDQDGKCADERCMARFFEAITRFGRHLLNTAFETSEDRTKLQTIGARLRLYAKQLGMEGLVPIVTVDGSAHHELCNLIPFEILPLLAIDAIPTRESPWTESANLLLGYNTIVVRWLPFEGARSDTFDLDPTGRLPLRFFQDFTLKGVKSEHRFLARNDAHFVLDGPMPDEKTPPDAAHGMAVKNLANPYEPFDRAVSDVPPQVLHFSTHGGWGDPDNRHEQDFCLSLNNGGSKRWIYAQDIHEQSFPLRKPGGPLVFLNACYSASGDAHYLLGLVEILLRRGVRGVLGCYTTIPDRFASAFSRAVYRRLLLGEEMGAAVLAA